MTSQEERLSSKNITHMYLAACNAISTSEQAIGHFNRTPDRCVAARHNWEDAGAISLHKLPQRITRKA